MRSSFLCVIGLLCAGFASAGTIVSVTGTPGTGWFVGGSAGGDTMLVSGWTQTGSYNNVSVSAEIGDGFGVTSIEAWLTNQIGPGTTAANVIATTSITPTTADEVDTLFTGESLGPGSYYLLLAAPGSVEVGNWWGTASPTVTTDAGVTGNMDAFADHPSNTPDDAFPPDSAFDTSTADNSGVNLLMTVTGDAVSATPEPSSFILIGLAGAFLIAPKLRARR